VRGPGPPGWGKLRWDSDVWVWVLHDSNQCVIALQIIDPHSYQRGRLTWRSKKEIVKQRKLKSGHGLHKGPTPRQTDRLTLGRNITWTWIWTWTTGVTYEWLVAAVIQLQIISRVRAPEVNAVWKTRCKSSCRSVKKCLFCESSGESVLVRRFSFLIIGSAFIRSLFYVRELFVSRVWFGQLYVSVWSKIM
jgi:hypothetical protein